MNIDWAKIRAITFDVGSTLIDPWPSVGHVYAEVAARHGHAGLDPEELTRRFVAAWRRREGFGYSRAEWAALVATALDGFSPLARDASFFRDLYEYFGTAAPWRVYEDVLPTLTSLTMQGLRLGLISNWDERLRGLLAALGLSAHFEVIAISAEVGAHKPDSEIFAWALKRLNVPASAVLHVGDNLQEDVLGARGAGWPALLLDRKSNGGDGVLTSLTQLVEALGTRNAAPIRSVGSR